MSVTETGYGVRTVMLQIKEGNAYSNVPIKSGQWWVRTRNVASNYASYVGMFNLIIDAGTEYTVATNTYSSIGILYPVIRLG